MKKLVFLAAVFVSFIAQPAFSYDLPQGALTYGLTSIQNSADDPVYGGNLASTEFNICMSEAPSGGAASNCLSDESGKIRKEIDALMHQFYESITLPADAKIRYIDSVKTDLHKIDYLCKMFNIDSTGEMYIVYNNHIRNEIITCEISRLSVLRDSVTRALSDV
ncbi:hypothetical protein D8682_04690 [Buttiauxella sp. 3AFRM03]|uniref:hypothetical protein n=1 Tax=Buttiauxella sp. 3AFRM03 TaxID=2479367 RepID=UPI000EF800A8|nr:hypothetical protein [Buttiauxella sp. 3AFRM03]AYN26354.1 hypothetical protein D8682_04690 [Buttiauxella sp. 3AFRM03]